jgi:VIT1/CCC1 family predicted Fe2+/Mn2+ transporter
VTPSTTISIDIVCVYHTTLRNPLIERFLAKADQNRQSPQWITARRWLGKLQPQQENQQIYLSLRKERLKPLYSRLVMAFLGGFALIIPMLIMTLHHTCLTALLTTSLCVIVVAVFLAVYLENADPKDVMGVVAAYAAVLVVFVGAGSGSGTS